MIIQRLKLLPSISSLLEQWQLRALTKFNGVVKLRKIRLVRVKKWREKEREIDLGEQIGRAEDSSNDRRERERETITPVVSRNKINKEGDTLRFKRKPSLISSVFLSSNDKLNVHQEQNSNAERSRSQPFLQFLSPGLKKIVSSIHIHDDSSLVRMPRSCTSPVQKTKASRSSPGSPLL